MPTEDQRQIAELKDRVGKLEAQVQFLYQHLGVTFKFDPGSSDDPRVIAMLPKGDKIGAIKVYREIYNVGLPEAKTAVEGLQSRLGK
jgi:ribosomal protein L7/L12